MDRETVLRLAEAAGMLPIKSRVLAAEWWSVAPEDLERFAAAVAAAVKEEDARICEENIAGISYSRTNQGPCLSPFDKEGGGRHDGMTYAAAIRASIKEVK